MLHVLTVRLTIQGIGNRLLQDAVHSRLLRQRGQQLVQQLADGLRVGLPAMHTRACGAGCTARAAQERAVLAAAVAVGRGDGLSALGRPSSCGK